MTTQAFYTAQTCGDACWRAREDVCRCSCIGANHGILRSDNSEQPARTRKLYGAMFQLVAVAAPGGSSLREIEGPLRDTEHDIFKAARTADRLPHYIYDNPQPTYSRLANASQVDRWPELAAWRGHSYRPLCLWVRKDMLDLCPQV